MNLLCSSSPFLGELIYMLIIPKFVSPAWISPPSCRLIISVNKYIFISNIYQWYICDMYNYTYVKYICGILTSRGDILTPHRLPKFSMFWSELHTLFNPDLFFSQLFSQPVLSTFRLYPGFDHLPHFPRFHLIPVAFISCVDFCNSPLLGLPAFLLAPPSSFHLKSLFGLVKICQSVALCPSPSKDCRGYSDRVLLPSLFPLRSHLLRALLLPQWHRCLAWNVGGMLSRQSMYLLSSLSGCSSPGVHVAHCSPAVGLGSAVRTHRPFF